MSSIEQAKPVTNLWIVEDGFSYRVELIEVLNAEPDFNVSQAFTSVEELEAFLIAHPGIVPPDLVLMDFGLPGQDGMAGAQLLGAHYPESKVLMLTSYQEPERIFKALKFGAVGYIVKSLPIDQILSCIRNAVDGALYVAAPVARRVLDHFDQEPAFHLTPRESQVLKQLATGATQKQIAKTLGISPDTVNNHVRNIFAKFQVKSATAAVARAYQFGFL